MKTTASWDNLIINLVLKQNSHSIKEVTDLKSVASLSYSQEDYKEIKDLITSNKIDELKLMKPKPESGFREYLEIMSFKDQHLNEYIIPFMTAMSCGRIRRLLRCLKGKHK